MLLGLRFSQLIMNHRIFWDLAPCILFYSSTLKMEAVRSS
jgi:hypothetical protein